MSMMFLNPFDNSGLGLYSKTAKSLVQRMPVLAKQRKPKSRHQRYHTEQDQQQIADQIYDNERKTTNTLLPVKTRVLKLSEPFGKSLSREQRIMGRDGKNKNPAVGAYHPKDILKEPKYVWNVLGVYQKSVNHKKQILDRKQKLLDSQVLAKSRRKDEKQQQNPEGVQVIVSKQQSELWDNMIQPQQIKFDRFKFRNSSPFVDMKRMLGRDATSARQQQTSYIQTLQSYDNQGAAFLTSQQKKLSPSKHSGTIQFNKQLSRQKISSLFKRNSNLVYDCNYSLVCANNKIGPTFEKMVNRDGKSIQTEINDQECPDYSEIWLNRNKKSLPNLEMILKRRINKEKMMGVKTEGDKRYGK